MTLTEMLALYENATDPIEIIPPSGDDLDSPERIARQRAQGPRRGDMWMAVDEDGNDSYVMITMVDGGRVTVIPLSNDAHDETRDSLVIERTPLDAPMIAWPLCRTSIPARLLYRPMKGFDSAVVDAVEAGAPGEGVRRGMDPDDGMSPAFEDRDMAAITMIAWHIKR